jgi:hypothetical protein
MDSQPVINFNTVLVEISKLELNPGDVLVIKVHDDSLFKKSNIIEISNALDKALPKDVKAVIVPSQYEFQVIRNL